MKLKIFIILSIVTTIIYLITFPSYLAGLHAGAMIMLFLLYLFTGKVAADANKVNFKFRMWINGMLVIMLVLPVIIAPENFSRSLIIFRGVSSLLVIFDLFKKESKSNQAAK